MTDREECDLSKAVCTVTIDLVQALALERDSLKEQIHQRDRDIATLRGQNYKSPERQTRPQRDDKELGERSETTYLHIIGGLLTLMLERSRSAQLPSRGFTTQEAVIDALVEQYGSLSGISERTLLAKFAAARRSISCN